MVRVPAPRYMKQSVIGVCVLVAAAPLVLSIVIVAIGWLIESVIPLLPYAIALIFMIGIFRLVMGRYTRL